MKRKNRQSWQFQMDMAEELAKYLPVSRNLLIAYVLANPDAGAAGLCKVAFKLAKRSGEPRRKASNRGGGSRTR